MITLTGHSSINISASKEIWIDPFKLDRYYGNADIILITHPHYDHFSPDDIEKVKKEDSVIVAPCDIESADYKLLPGDELEIDGVVIRAVPAYNKLKPFHPKKNNWLGYIVTIDGETFYICGDTDKTKEAESISCDTLLVPCGGTYTMNAKEAASLANCINPKKAIPTHYGSIVGSVNDGEEFKNLLLKDIECELLI